MQNTGFKIQNTEYRIQNTEYRIQNTEYRIQNAEYILEIHVDIRDTEYSSDMREYTEYILEIQYTEKNLYIIITGYGIQDTDRVNIRDTGYRIQYRYYEYMIQDRLEIQDIDYRTQGRC